MKSIITLLLLLIMPFVTVWAQEKIDTLHESKKLPDFKFYTVTDSVVFTPDLLQKNKPILFIYFNTECDHCEAETKALKENIAALKGVTIIMVSRQQRSKIAAFVSKMDLNNYPILMLMDADNKIHDYLDFSYIPCVRLYDKKWKLMAAWNEQAPIGDIIYYFHQ